MKTHVLTALFVAALAAAPAFAQDAESRSGIVRREPLTFAADEIVMRYFKPRRVNGEKLFDALKPLHGRNILVRSEEGGQPRSVGNMSMFGDMVVLYDTPAQVERIVTSMVALEEAALAQVDSEAGAEPAQELVTREFTPGFVSLRAIREAVRPYVRLLSPHELDVEGHREAPLNVNLLEDPPRVIVRDTAEGVEEILALLRSVDVPRPQVMMTTYLLSPSGTFASPLSVAPPRELVEHLARLTPYPEFDTMALSSLRLNVGQGEETTLALGGPAASVGELTLGLAGLTYDDATGALSIGSVQLERKRDGRWTTALRTTFTAYRGEFAVVGLIGDQPLLLAVTFETLPAPRASTSNR